MSDLKINGKPIQNPTRDIFFFANHEAKICYVFMSLEAGKDIFYKMFPNAEEITKQLCDELEEYGVVFVGDSEVIDEYFNDDELKQKTEEAKRIFYLDHKKKN